ncbi:YdeI/OmpD-associated family protein [Chelativorans sp. YIM 93263]|uniref:YdeI/OmpD-associated family protein n=1 Tax=Chelativorans sp. YIM 93263 TaxID=2906648 RepID=UPI00237977A3|nr:YdeI/OmpD-associated family protein [Chelativorans sp. YIM 93263]
MPDDVRAALDGRDLMAAYEERPAYQRNDYLHWIARAKRAETRDKRLQQMLDELRRGDVYMRMRWAGKSR